MTDAPRIGAVTFLNARPLVHGLEERLPDSTISFDHPSRLADALRTGALDLALIPSIEYLRGASIGYRIVPGICIAAHGPVLSVKLFCRKPVDRIRRLALDAASRSSQALAEIWLRDSGHGWPATIEELPLGASPLESTADAVLAIGDKAMRVPDDAFPFVVDLSEAWSELTGLPFVFAFWVARPGFALDGVTEILQSCRDDGLLHAASIADAAAPRLGLSPAVCLDYLTRRLSFSLDPKELAGLRLFAARAAAHGLAPAGVELAFLEDRRDLAARR